MEYNALQNAWTPCQIGKVRQRMASEDFRYRKYIARKWCRLAEHKTITIQDSVTWRGAKDLEGNLIIAEGGYLRVESRISMPPGSTITIRPGGRLILGPTARLHNACGKTWEGIIVEGVGRQMGQIVMEGKPVIEQIRNPIPEPTKT